MSNEIELSTPRLSNSKSCDDLSTIEDNDLEMYNHIRQGAIRKRFISTELNYKKNLDESKIMIKNVSFSYESDQTYEKENGEHKRKFSVGSLIAMKEMWKSLKKDNKEKDEIKKNLNLLNVPRCCCKIDDQEIKSFLETQGNKLNDLIEQPLMTLDTFWDVFLEKNKESAKSYIELQTALWEIIETEFNFLKQLNIVIKLFYPLLEKFLVRYHVALCGVEMENIFGNIKDIYADHWNLWNDYLAKPLLLSKKEYLEISLMKEGFCKIETILSNYNHFMQILPTMRKTIGKLQNGNVIFNKYVEWTKTYSRLCHDGCLYILHAPFQRITKYKLLLERVKSLCDDDQESDINEMINNVHNFLKQINSSFVGQYSMKDIKEKIVQNNIGNSIFFDMGKFVNDESMLFDIMKPLNGFNERILIHEGKLKLKKSLNKTLEIQCYLCNDLFMMCKPIKGNWDKLTMYKAPIRLDKMLVKEDFEDCLVIKVFSDFKVVEGIFVLNGELEEIKLWINKCSKTICNFITQYKEKISPAIYPSDSKESGYFFDDNLFILQRSGTSSFSRRSVDLTPSQTSETSSQTDNSNAFNKKPILIETQHQKYYSAEDLFNSSEF